MGRFDQNESNPDNTQVEGGTAAEKLRSTVEQQVREVVEEAMARAFAIEDRALAEARRIEEDYQRRANVVLQTSIDRAEGMVGAIETLETEMEKVIRSFREEMEALTSDLRKTRASLDEPHEPPPGEPAEATPAAEAPSRPAPAGEDPAREKIRQQLIRLQESGKPREEAERYLKRFKQGDDYVAMLDGIYPPSEPDSVRKRGLLRRK